MTKKPSMELRLIVLSAIDHAPGNSIVARIKSVAARTFNDPITGCQHQFTWRTISTWLYRFKKHGMTTLDKKSRSDKNQTRKISIQELAEAIKETLPRLRHNKSGIIPKSVIYRRLLEEGYFQRNQLAPSTFYHLLQAHNLMDETIVNKLRLSFAMQYANELWQADTMYGPSIKQTNGRWRKAFLIAFIDDASRVITHAQWFYHDDTASMIEAFKAALFKRGKPERLYFDNGSNYTSKEILQACVRLNIYLSHAPVRDGAAKGKIERFFRGFRDRFLTQHLDFENIGVLNQKTSEWIENQYNSQPHSGIQMVPIDRFNLDSSRIQFLTDDEYTEEVFFIEEDRKVSKTNVFSIHKHKFECPVDLREKTIQVRFDRTRRHCYVVYFAGKRMGNATPLNLHFNANGSRQNIKETT